MYLLCQKFIHDVLTNFILTDNSRTAVETDPLSVTLDSTSVTSLTVSWVLPEELTATSYTISYSNTNNTQCFTDSNDITGIAASETTYTLTDLQENTEYSITVTALLSDGETERDTLAAATMASGKCFIIIMLGRLMDMMN